MSDALKNHLGFKLKWTFVYYTEIPNSMRVTNTLLFAASFFPLSWMSYSCRPISPTSVTREVLASSPASLIFQHCCNCIFNFNEDSPCILHSSVMRILCTYLDKTVQKQQLEPNLLCSFSCCWVRAETKWVCVKRNSSTNAWECFACHWSLACRSV